MTKYVDRDYWEDSILMPDKSTPVLGGTPVWDGDSMLEGFSNISAAQLADRTRNLKNKLDQVASVVEGDGFLRVADNLADLEDIGQAKFNLVLNNVDNTSDLDKPLSNATVAALAGKQDSLDSITQEEIVTGTDTTPKTVSADVLKASIEAIAPAQTDITGNAGTATKLQTPRTINGVDFDGSADITINAEDATPRIASSEKGEVNGVATLDSSGKVPSEQLPSSVDNVLEYPSLVDFPTTGESGKIYIATDSNYSYRWGGSDYLEINSSPPTSASKTEVLSASSFTTFVTPDSYGNVISWYDNGAISTGTLTLDLNTSLNHTVGVGGNITVATPSNNTLGKTGDIVLTLTANAVVSWATTWKFLGSVPNIGNSGSKWVISYKVLSGTEVLASAAKVA